MSIKKAIYAGSFDPFTNGHDEIIQSALKIFDEIIILLGVSPTKNPFFSTKQRLEMVEKHFAGNKRIVVKSSNGLIVEYAKKNKINTLIRGLRPTGGFSLEFQMAIMNNMLHPEIETVFFTGKKYHFISSGLVREVFTHGGKYEDFVPSIISNLMKKYKA